MAEKEYIYKNYALYLVNYFGNMQTWSKEDIISEIERKITECPLADVEPVRHGHWYNRGGRFRCSVCDNKALLKDIGGTGGWSHEYEQQKSPYCPNCGAKMDGDNNLDINCCEYCRVNDDFKCSVIHFDGGDNGTVDVQMPFDEMEIIYRKDEKTVFHLDFEINYCPMCGRKLKTDGKENENDPR